VLAADGVLIEHSVVVAAGPRASTCLRARCGCLCAWHCLESEGAWY
jgi:hypothetical protein